MMRITAFLLIVMISVGCATKEERARTNIQGTWRISNVFEAGQDITAQYTQTRVNYRITFDGNNGFVEVYQQFNGGDDITVAGTWDFSDSATQLTLASSSQSRIYSIDKLDEDELHITDLSSSNDRQIQLDHD